jgi:hypothetical protein
MFLVIARLGHLGQHFMKPSDSVDITASRMEQFIQGAGLLNV